MEIDFSVYITLGILISVLALFLFALRFSRRIPSSVRNDIYKQLKQIKINIDADLVSANRDSVVRLDTLLSKALQLRLRNSNTCGENLKLAKALFKKDFYEKIWHYHKLRNSVVHENINVRTKEAKLAYRVYSKAISKLLE